MREVAGGKQGQPRLDDASDGGVQLMDRPQRHERWAHTARLGPSSRKKIWPVCQHKTHDFPLFFGLSNSFLEEVCEVEFHKLSTKRCCDRRHDLDQLIGYRGARAGCGLTI